MGMTLYIHQESFTIERLFSFFSLMVNKMSKCFIHCWFSCVLPVLQYMHAEVYSRVPADFAQSVMTAREREQRGDQREKELADMLEKERENDKLFQKNRHEPSDST